MWIEHTQNEIFIYENTPSKLEFGNSLKFGDKIKIHKKYEAW